MPKGQNAGRKPGPVAPIKLTFLDPVDENSIMVAKNTQAMQLAQQVAGALVKTPVGKAVRLHAEGAKRHFRFSLQKRLQKMGHKVSVVFGQSGELYVKRVS